MTERGMDLSGPYNQPQDFLSLVGSSRNTVSNGVGRIEPFGGWEGAYQLLELVQFENHCSRVSSIVNKFSELFI